jgi:hypothetical protein
MEEPGFVKTLAPRVRLFIFEHFLDHAMPPVVEQVMGTFSIGRDEKRPATSRSSPARPGS